MSILITLVLAAASAAPNTVPFTTEAARVYIAQARQTCEREAGRTWGISLCGPVMIADPATRRVVSSEAMPDANQVREGGVFVGTLPAGIGIANTAINWKGQRWTALQWPLPADATERRRLMMHEAWHRIQPELGLIANERKQEHLATRDGRMALRLELRALRQAILTTGHAADAAFRDALFFRAWRYARFPDAAADEAALEANEGLAEYTGWATSSAIGDRPRLARHLERGDVAASLTRSFAYFTGPAWGAMLDKRRPAWRTIARSERSLPLASLLPSIRAPLGSLAERGAEYGFSDLLAAESAMADARERADAKWRALLVDGPILVIPMMAASIVFDPNAVHPLPEGSVHPRIEARGPWGLLEATQGALVSNDWSAISVPAAAIERSAATLTGAGWTLHPAPGWRLRGDTAPFRLTKDPEARP